MPDAMSMSIMGGQELDNKLQRLGSKVVKKHLTKALRAGAKLILADARSRVPVLSGKLKRSLAVRIGKKRRGVHEKTITVRPDSKKEPDLVTFGKDGKRYFYPAAVEYGTRKRKAKPFMRPAFDSQKQKAVKAIMAQLLKGVEEEATKGVAQT